MIRYVQQTDQFRCGPVAIANAIKWTGARFSYEKNKSLIDVYSNCTPPKGSWPKEFNFAFRKLGKKFLKIRRHFVEEFKDSIRQLDDHLQEGGAAIIRISFWGIDGIVAGHYFLCIKKKNRFYTCVNYNPSRDKTTITQVFELSLRDELAICREDPADIWFLKKRGH